MNYHTCKCGKREYWESGMPVHACMGCDECGTSYRKKDGVNVPLEPHDFKTYYHEITGKPYKICKKCYHIDRESFKEASTSDTLKINHKDNDRDT